MEPRSIWVLQGTERFGKRMRSGRERAGMTGHLIEFNFPEICRELWERMYVFYVAYGGLFLEKQRINRKKNHTWPRWRDDASFISYILFPEFYLKLLCNLLFPTLLYVAFLVNKCICATSFFCPVVCVF